jgi:hypothetical protein
MFYIRFILTAKLNINPYDNYLDYFNEIMLLIMYLHFFYFVDGGLLYGIDTQISI